MAIDNHGFTPDKNIYNLTSILSRLDALEQAGRSVSFDNVYPVGSIYITTDNRNPGTYFTGTVWERYGNGRTIVGVNESDSDFNAAGKTGGEKVRNYTAQGRTDNTQLQEQHLPSHRHRLGLHTHAFQYSGAKGSQTDSNIYTNYHADPVGQWDVNIWIPRNTGGATEDGTLQVRKVASSSQATNRLAVGNPEGETVTNATGGNVGHNHTFKANTIALNTVQPYITCYIWRRKS